VVDALTGYLQKSPRDVKYFGVRLTPDVQPVREDVERAADERMMIRLKREATNSSISAHDSRRWRSWKRMLIIANQ